MENGDRVYHPEYGYGKVVMGGKIRVLVRWDDGSQGGAEVKQLITEKQAKKKGY